MEDNTQPGARIVSKLIRGAIIASVIGIAVGCLDRPVSGLPTTTQTIVNEVVRQQAVDKVDLLFAIDNSRSMGDKQALLGQAVPDLITRLLTPDCVDATDPMHPTVVARNMADDTCPLPSKDEFPPVYDMHIGIVTSSLGGGGADLCPSSGGADKVEPLFNKYSAHGDDKGHLINRARPTAANATGIEDTIANANPMDGSGGDFLAWLPASNPKNKDKPPPNVPVEPDQPALTADFTKLVLGTQEYGCGLEAQMESWYRFLIQPDPYDSIALNPDPSGVAKATLNGVDATVIKQRHDFLRPDSLVAVIMMTDEEDSWSDPLADIGGGGHGWTTRTNAFPDSPTGLMPLGTHECNEALEVGNVANTGPNDPDCTSCAYKESLKPKSKQRIGDDSNCQTSCGAGCQGYYTQKDDNLNIRYVNDMKRRYGLDPQFPVSRYANGLKSLHVPSRDGEHPGGGGNYKGENNCINPLFAKTLPTDASDNSLCDPSQQSSALGPRSPDLVYFAIIGGVPWQLLADPKTQAFKDTLSNDDWEKIIGKDPDHYDLTGIDPHMIESYLPRTAANQASIPYLSAPLADVTSSDTSDPYNGREWNTTLSPLKLDLQYACTFALPTNPKDGKPGKDCADPAVCSSAPGCACDCIGTESGPTGAPLCAPGLNGSSRQVRGKAYPTIRELRLAKALAGQAIVASLCPKSLDTTSPDYGYRPAVRQIIGRLKASLAGQCLPQALTADTTGAVPCLILETLPQGDQSLCDDATKGLAQPVQSILDKLNEQRCADAAAAGLTGDAGPGKSPCVDPDNPAAVAAVLGPVCEVQQLLQPADYTGTCETTSKAGWCYVVGTAAGCNQAIKFSATGQPPTGAKISLQCLESSLRGDGG